MNFSPKSVNHHFITYSDSIATALIAETLFKYPALIKYLSL
jgi:hypothetical protein